MREPTPSANRPMLYYSTGQTLSGPRLQQLYRDALRDAHRACSSPLRTPITKRLKRS